MDLVHRRPMGLLERCEEQAIRAWLQAHSGIALVSRDRGKMDTKAIRLSARHVQEVLDRWHLLRNLGEMFQKGLAKVLPLLPTRRQHQSLVLLLFHWKTCATCHDPVSDTQCSAGLVCFITIVNGEDRANRERSSPEKNGA